MKNKLTALGLGFCGLVLKVGTVFAQTATPKSVATINIVQPSEVRIVDFGKLISAVIGLILILAGLAAFIYLIWGGFEWLTSGGDKAGIEKARGKIANAIIGLIIVFSSWALFTIIENFLGIKILGGAITLPQPFVLDTPTPGP